MDGVCPNSERLCERAEIKLPDGPVYKKTYVAIVALISQQLL